MSLLLVLAGCLRDPAYDRPIEPWPSPAVPPKAESGNAGGWRALDAGPATVGDAGLDSSVR